MIGSLARFKTSEVMRRAASLLEPVDRAAAAELRVRARWIEVTRHDTGVSQERRLAIAAIEDVDQGEDRRPIVDVHTPSGWRLLVLARIGGAYDATVFRPDGTQPYSSAFRPEPLDEAIDHACDYVRETLRDPDVASALRALAR